MKAVVYTEYGSPDVLQLKEVDKPAPADDRIKRVVFEFVFHPATYK